MTVTPTGAQHEIGYGDQRAVVVQVGGGLRSYDVAGRPVVDGFAASARPDGGRGQVLAPWPNRIRDGRYGWAGTAQQLALSEAANHNAIHGLVRWLPWSLLERSETAVSLGVRVWPQPGYPFLLDLAAGYALGEDGLSVSLTASNAGDDALPYGVGQHPYVSAGTDVVDDAVLTVPAAEWVRCDERGLPVATEPVDGTPYDFRSGALIRDTVLDTPYSALTRDGQGRVVVRLARADAAHGVEVWLGAGAAHLQVFSGDTLAPARRRRGLAVEPMSCLPDAFNSGAGLVTLEPGASYTLGWGLRGW